MPALIEVPARPVANDFEHSEAPRQIQVLSIRMIKLGDGTLESQLSLAERLPHPSQRPDPSPLQPWPLPLWLPLWLPP